MAELHRSAQHNRKKVRCAPRQCETDADLASKISSGSFRQDLYFRLARFVARNSAVARGAPTTFQIQRPIPLKYLLCRDGTTPAYNYR